MRNATIFVLVVAVGALGALGIFAYHQEASLREQRLVVQQLTARLASISKTASIDLQQKCARQAREEFTRDGWESRSMAGFTNHYNSELGKCFILIGSTSDAKTPPGTVFENKSLSDAFEGKSYAEYFWHSDTVKKYWEVPPLVCRVTMPSGEERVCHSSDEFDELVKVYMQ
jgi:hypothetical protein